MKKKKAAGFILLYQLNYSRIKFKRQNNFVPEVIIVEAKKVLVVDDDEKNRKLMKDLLEYKKMEVVIAENGKKALEVLTKDIEIAIVDIRLPDIDGYEVGKRIKEKYPSIKLIAYTASALKAEKNKIAETGLFDDVLLKPIKLDDFDKIIKKFL